MDLLSELRSLINRFDKEHIEYALCGGLALAVYALPKASLDIDVLARPDDIPRIIEVVSELGYNSGSRPRVFKQGIIKIHTLTKREDQPDDLFTLDLLVVTPVLEKVWAGKTDVAWGDEKLTVVSPAGLIKLKLLRNSRQDADDIEYLRSITDED